MRLLLLLTMMSVAAAAAAARGSNTRPTHRPAPRRVGADLRNAW